MNKVTRKFFVVALMMSFVAAGKPATVPPAAEVTPAKPWLQQLNAAAIAKPKKFAHLARLRKDVPADGLSEQVKLELVKDQLFVEDPAITAYLTELVDQLLAGWKGAKPSVVVLVKSDAEAGAYSTADGEIVIYTGMLRRLAELPKYNEATLAALLSHELSHILLGHSALTKLSNKLDMIVQSAGTTAAAAQVYGDPSTEDASDALETYAGTQVATMLWSDLMRTRNDREEEKQADELGTDLTLAAGFDSVGWEQLFLDILKQAAAKLSARMSLLQKLLQSGGATEVQKQAFDWIAKLNASHPPTSVRDDNRKSYEDNNYGKAGAAGKRAPRTPGQFEAALRAGSGAEVLKLDTVALDLEKAIKSRDQKKAAELFGLLTKDPKSMQPRALFVAAQYAEAKKDFAKAESFLASLTSARYPPASGYTSLASLRDKHLKDPLGAIQPLEAGKSRLGDRRPFLPLLAGINLKAGNTEIAEKYARLCGCPTGALGFLSGDAMARKLLGEQTNDLKQKCIKEMGYDVDAKPSDREGLLGGVSTAGQKLLGLGKCIKEP